MTTPGFPVGALGMLGGLEFGASSQARRPAASETDTDNLGATRVVSAGGSLNHVITHPDAEPFEHLFRRLPEAGIHNPNLGEGQNFFMELGSFRVPPQMLLIVFDFRPDVYRFSGIDPSDAVPVEQRRFASQMGFEVLVDNKHPGNLRFELEPIPAQTGKNRFGSSSSSDLAGPEAFEQVRFNRFGGPAGSGLATLPQRPTRFGGAGLETPTLPMAIIAEENQVFAVNLVVFRPVTSPIAFIEFTFAGSLLPQNTAKALLRQMRPVR